MESANLHHQQYQLQDQLLGSSSSLATPSWYGVGSNHAWTPNNILNTGNFNQNISRDLFESRDSRQLKNDIIVPPSLHSSMIQDLGFHWTSQSVHDLQNLAKIKEELSSDSFPKFTEMINSSSSTIEEDLHLPPTSYIKNEHRDFNDLSEKLLLKTLSSGSQINGHQHYSAGGFSSNAQNYSSFGGGGALASRGNFSQIFPSVNISNLNQSSLSSSAISNNLDMNLQALDLLSTSARFSGSISQPPSHDNLSFGPDHMQQLTRMPSNNPNKISPFINGVTEAKRPNSYMDPTKASSKAAVPKKSRLEPRASCPPFKVRKEKLGDRIAALQQLVAPFGKTDTASVLMEAIGYIKFLQNQVETLSVPYMKSSRNRNCRTMHMGQTEENRNEEAKPDLRSRGLCLVPLSCTSYITNDGGGGGFWPPNDYSGGT